ncbi:MAG TPA: hypothetical protein VH370_11195 [Humisphaera sp.]|nr:hypothetical protein [Humisphaera sp.]
MPDQPARLPEGAAISVSVHEQHDDHGMVHIVRRRILGRSVEQRRHLLAAQSRLLQNHYQSDADCSNLGSGDIVE